MYNMNILVFNPFGIGDVLFSTPLIRNLKEKINNCSITYVCNRRVEPLLNNNKFIDRVIVFEKDEWRNLGRKSKFGLFKKIITQFREIKNQKFDCLFDLSMNAQYGLFFKLTGIKKRIGYNYKNRGKFLTDKFDLSKGYQGRHVADFFLDLLSAVGLTATAYPFDIFLPKKKAITKPIFLSHHNLPHQNFLIAVVAGSGDSWNQTAYFKRWPEEYFVELIERIQSELSAEVVLFGSKSEVPLTNRIYSRLAKKPLQLSGELNLESFIEHINICDLVISNDGGPFHIAQALKKKAVVFYGPVDEKVYGVYPDSSICAVFTGKVDCRPCYESFKFPECKFDKLCLRRITTDSVFSQIEKIISG